MVDTRKNLKTNIARLCIFVLYCTAVFLILSYHENWRDEAQAWLLARDLTIPGLIDQMAYEGHPCLWHLILMPFAKLGLPFWTTGVISTLIVIVSAGLLLWKSPIPPLLLVPALFGSAFLYLMPVVSRSYCLIPLFTFLCAHFYKSRNERVFAYGISLALLVQTHLYMVAVAGVMSAIWFFEAIKAYLMDKEKNKLYRQCLGLALPLLSFFLFVYQISGCSDSSAFVFEVSGILNLIRQMISSPLKFFMFGSYVLTYSFAIAFVLLIFLAFTRLIFRWNVECFKVMCGFIIQVIAVLLLFVLFDRVNLQKASIIVCMTIWLVWTAWPHMKDPWVKACVLLAYLTVACGYILFNSIIVEDLKEPYSDAKYCAQFMEENIPNDAVIVQSNGPAASTLVAYMNADGFYSMDSGELESFITWKEQHRLICDYSSLCTWIERIDPEKDKIYYVHVPGDYGQIGDIEDFLTDDRLLYRSTKNFNISGEVFAVYELPLK